MVVPRYINTKLLIVSVYLIVKKFENAIYCL